MKNIDKVEWVYNCRKKNIPVDINTTGGYTFEEIMNNKNCDYNLKYWHNIKDTNRFLFKSKTAESWEFYDPWIENPVRNTNQIYLRFLNTSKFTEVSNYHKEHKAYTLYPKDTIGYNKFWDEEENKCDNGVWDNGIYLTGRHYFTINYGRFRARPTDKDGNTISNTKRFTFLGFLDHQYYTFHELEEVFLDGIYRTKKEYLKNFPLKTIADFELLSISSLVGAKGRRKGWTALMAIGGITYNFVFRESSNSLIAAGEKGHYGPMLTGVRTTKNWINKSTPWIRRTELKGQETHFVSSFYDKDAHGNPIVEGYLSEVQYSSFKDNPFKSIGDSVDLLNIEEPGKFDNLLKAFPISMEPLVRDGEIRIGSVVAVGTAGDMEAGGSQSLYTMVYKPILFGAKEFDNIYEENEVDGKSGWFIDDLWYSPNKIKKETILKLDSSERVKFLLDKIKGDIISTVDPNGNSYRFFADLILQDKRIIMRQASLAVYNKFITQQPRYLSDAFLIDETSPFDTTTAKVALSDLISREDSTLIEKGSFYIDKEKGVKWQIDLKANFINRFPWKENNTEGCWVIYEHPVKIEKQSYREPGTIYEETSRNRYIAGTDPVDWGSGETSSNDKRRSFAATYIIDTLTRNIVAEYVSRPIKADDYFEQLWRGLDYYNAVLLYENNLKSLYSYFNFKNKMYLLVEEPDSLRGKTDKNRNKRVKGFHASAAANSYARDKYNKYTLEQVPSGQDVTTGEITYLPRMYSIPSIGLLQETIAWNTKGNFDRISGIGAVMILLFDKTYSYDEDDDIANGDKLYTGIFKKVKKLTNNKRLNKYRHASWR